MNYNDSEQLKKEGYEKVLFRLKQDEDGYPPEAIESVWPKKIDEGIYEIDNIPFYVPNLSCGDQVSVKNISGELFFDSVIKYSDESTFRIIVFDLEKAEAVRADLISLNCSVEKSGIPGFMAVGMPATADSNKVISYLESGQSTEQWDYEESSIRF